MKTADLSRPRSRLAAYPTLMTVSVLTRLVVNTGSQLFNPFLTIIAAGLGTNVVTLGQILAGYNATALLSPFFGNLADRWGYRATMRLELLISIIGLLLLGSAMNLWLATVGALVMGLGFFSFVPTLRAYLAELLPYHRRARGFGILEYSWALSGIVGLYLMGQLIAVAGWRAPFFVLAAGLVVAWFIYGELPATHHAASTGSAGATSSAGATGATGAIGAAVPQRDQSIGDQSIGDQSIWHRFQQQLVAFFYLEQNRRSAWAAILGGTLANFGMLHIAIAYGAWLVTEYQLSAQQLGVVAFVIGCADLCGSGGASLFADRMDKRSGVIVSWSGAGVIALLLPWFNANLIWAVTALALLRVTSEYGIISHMSLVSGQSTTQRGKVMTLAFAVSRVGSIFAGFTGPAAYTMYGVQGLGPVAAVAIGLAVVAILWGTRELSD